VYEDAVILQAARIYSFAPGDVFGGSSAAGVYAENITGVQYRFLESRSRTEKWMGAG